MPPDAPTPPPDALRPRIQKIQVQGISIVIMNFARATAAETLEMLAQYPALFIGQEPNSIRLLTDVTDLQYDPGVSNKWKAARVDFDPYVRATAVYGITGLVGMAVRAHTEIGTWLGLPNAKTKIRTFATRDKALAWLLEQ